MQIKVITFFVFLSYVFATFCAQEAEHQDLQKRQLRIRASSVGDDQPPQLASPLNKHVAKTMQQIDQALSPKSPKSPLEKLYWQKVKDAHEQRNLYEGDSSLVQLHKQASTKSEQLSTLLLVVNQIEEQAERSNEVRYGSPRYVGPKRAIDRKMSE